VYALWPFGFGFADLDDNGLCRYELEKGLVDGSIKVEQLPELWKERMTAYLGCTPADDAQGVLQDVHWSAGLFGYFPTYTLGAMFACQIYQVCCPEHFSVPITARQHYRLPWIYLAGIVNESLETGNRAQRRICM